MNSIVHFEIPVDDMAQAKAFYKEAFDWQVRTDKMPDGSEYNSAITAPSGDGFLPKEPGAINGALIKRDSTLKAPLVTVDVTSVDEAIEKVVKAGGKVVLSKAEAPGMGEYAYVSDPAGNVIGLWHNYDQ